jgi:hypothetical protein
VGSHLQRNASAPASGSKETAQRIVAALLPVVGQPPQRQQGAAPLDWHEAEARMLASCQLGCGPAALVPLCPQPPDLGGIPAGSIAASGAGSSHSSHSSHSSSGSHSSHAAGAAKPGKRHSLLSERLGELKKWEAAVRGWSTPSISLWNKA